ncbi:MAG TPA: sigma-70 family RNA polymerase sigma factor [Gaiellales bacterium]
MSTTMTFLTPAEAELLGRARTGDDRAYGELVDPHRRSLHAHCYRMLGSLEDADDAMQDALLRAWRGIGRFQGRSSLRTWLYTIATNACLQLVRRRPGRVLPRDYGPPAGRDAGRSVPLAETVWIEGYPEDALETAPSPGATYEERETLELAFVAVLQHLPPRQRAVLLLRDVLDFSAREAATLLETTVPSVNSALQRARETIRQRAPERSQQATLRDLGDERSRALVAAYIEAIEHADVDGVVALLTEDASWSMPPASTWYQGLDEIVGFLTRSPFQVRWRHLPASANGQLAVGCYTWDEERGDFEASVIDVLTLRGDRVAEVTAFIGGEPFPRFGLPARLPA